MDDLSAALRHPLRYLPLTLKVLAVTVAAGALVGLLLDRVLDATLERLYENELLTELDNQSRTERLRFDHEIKEFRHTTRVAAAYSGLHRFLTARPSGGGEVSHVVDRRPPWFPGRSMTSGAVHPRVAVVLDELGRVVATYRTQLPALPAPLARPTLRLLLLSHGQSLLTTIDDQPYLLSSAPVEDWSGRPLGTLLLGTPLDTAFLASVQRYEANPSISAVVTHKGGRAQILVSSDATQVPSGSDLAALKEQGYLVVGKAFFDYGASDLGLDFVSLRGREEIAQRLATVLHKARVQRGILTVAMAAVFLAALVWLIRRVRRLSDRVEQFARTSLESEIAGPEGMDSLHLLETRIRQMEELVVAARDREREAAADALRISEERLHLAIEGSNAGLWDWAVATGEVYFSPSWESMLGYQAGEVDGTIEAWEQHIHPDDRDSVMGRLYDHLAGHTRFYESEHRLRCKSGAWLWVLDRGKVVQHDPAGEPIRVVGTYANITERKRSEEEQRRLRQQMEHTQRLESLGVLAGGIAHDFNNLLTAIMGNLALARAEVGPLTPRDDYLMRAEAASRRAADLCRQMLAYSGKGRFVVRPVDLSELVQEMVHLLDLSVAKSTTLNVDLEPGLPLVDADAAQLQQVVMNLVINSAEAIGEGNGVISLSTRSKAISRTEMARRPFDRELPAGAYVSMEITDSGCGMDEETQRHIFDPFFTTKATGRGLGMCAVVGIIHGHRGALRLDSEPGRGTTFEMVLPASTKGAEGEGSSPPAASEWSGSGTVLVVDDEPAVRLVAQRILRKAGFEVVTADDGIEAIERFRAHQEEVVAVLLDMTMPRMGGAETFRALREIAPSVKVILTSGHDEQQMTERFTGQGLAGFIQKPYTPRGLRAKMHEVVGVCAT